MTGKTVKADVLPNEPVANCGRLSDRCLAYSKINPDEKEIITRIQAEEDHE